MLLLHAGACSAAAGVTSAAGGLLALALARPLRWCSCIVLSCRARVGKGAWALLKAPASACAALQSAGRLCVLRSPALGRLASAPDGTMDAMHARCLLAAIRDMHESTCGRAIWC
jgi:hypothetical protein